MFVRCVCGKLTNFGFLCINCSKEQDKGQEDVVSLEDIDVEELVEEDEN